MGFSQIDVRKWNSKFYIYIYIFNFFIVSSLQISTLLFNSSAFNFSSIVVAVKSSALHISSKIHFWINLTWLHMLQFLSCCCSKNASFKLKWIFIFSNLFYSVSKHWKSIKILALLSNNVYVLFSMSLSGHKWNLHVY